MAASPDEIRALVQRLRRSRPADRGAFAANELGQLAERGPAVCNAIADASGVEALSDCLTRSSTNGAKACAAVALAELLRGCGGRAAEAAVRAGAVQALVGLLRRADEDTMLHTAATTLSLIASDTRQQASAAAGANGVRALLRCLSSGRSHGTQAMACLALGALLGPSAEIRAAIIAQGGLRGLARCLRCRTGRRSGDAGADPCLAACEAIRMFVVCDALGGSRTERAFADAGIIPTMIECLTDPLSSPNLLMSVVDTLVSWCKRGPQRCQAVVAAGGAAALAGRLCRGGHDELEDRAVAALVVIHFDGDAEATDRFRPQAEAWNLSLELLASGRLGPEVQQAALAIAARDGLLAHTPAAPQQAAGEAAQALRAPRVCAACGATDGILRKCGGCRLVRYCSEACNRAHWRAHKPECRRLQAQQAAAAAAAHGGGEAASHP